MSELKVLVPFRVEGEPTAAQMATFKATAVDEWTYQAAINRVEPVGPVTVLVEPKGRPDYVTIRVGAEVCEVGA